MSTTSKRSKSSLSSLCYFNSLETSLSKTSFDLLSKTRRTYFQLQRTMQFVQFLVSALLFAPAVISAPTPLIAIGKSSSLPGYQHEDPENPPSTPNSSPAYGAPSQEPSSDNSPAYKPSSNAESTKNPINGVFGSGEYGHFPPVTDRASPGSATPSTSEKNNE
jgi:hypothetical protein